MPGQRIVLTWAVIADAIAFVALTACQSAPSATASASGCHAICGCRSVRSCYR
jgi:hypothetical protein